MSKVMGLWADLEKKLGDLDVHGGRTAAADVRLLFQTPARNGSPRGACWVVIKIPLQRSRHGYSNLMRLG